MKNEIKTLTDREHILLRPAMYIGATDLTKSEEYVLSDGKITSQEIEFVPGLIKIINELIDNSVDVAIKTNFKSSDQIDVKIDSNSVTVKDNGTGIPVKKMEDDRYMPLVAWNTAKSGSNFDDDENRTQMGMNGVGSYATNCFSNKFVGKTDDGEHFYEVIFKNNANEYTEKVEKSKGKSGTEVKFYPDLDRFNLKEIDDIHVKVIEQRLINLSMCFPEIRFRLNSKRVDSGSFKKFAEMFGEEPTIVETKNYRYAFLYNPEDDFRHFSYVNGLKIPEGGTHIDAVVEPVVQNIRERLQRRYKDIKPADIRNKLLVLAFLKDMPNTKFDSQTKEKITNSRSEINDYLGDINLDRLAAQVYKNKTIIDGITEIYKIKEEFKKRKEMKSLSKVKKVKSEKYIPAIKKKKYLLVVEGESALGGTLPAFGRDNISYYVLKGKPLNVITNTHQKFIANKELSELYQVIRSEDYEYIIAGTDMDLDGIHIVSLLSAFIHKMLPEHKDKFGRIRTPIKAVTKNDIPQRWVYNINDAITPKKGEEFNYYKGLGSWSADELKHIVEVEGFDKMIELFNFDDEKVLKNWLDKDSDPRKVYIQENDFSINSI